MATEITTEEAHKLLHYNPDTGEFHYKVKPTRRINIGEKAGTITFHGYLSIVIRGKHYLAHRLAWFMTYGNFPKSDLDHIDRDRLNNRISNLREVSKMENRHNTIMPLSTSKSGLRGVKERKRNGKWTAHIGVNGKTLFLGEFLTKEEAYAAYLAAKRIHHYAYAS